MHYEFETDKTIIALYEEWTQLSGNCNWYTITPIHIEFEFDKILGGIECNFVLLGLGIRIRFNYKETDTMKECKKAIKEYQENSSDWS